MKDAVRVGRVKAMLPYIFTFVALFYAVPIVARLDVQLAQTGLLFYMLYIFNPALSFGLNIMYAMKHGFIWYFPLFAGALFIPSIFIYYNQTAVIYIFAYIVLAYIGAAAGYSIFRGRDKPQ